MFKVVFVIALIGSIGAFAYAAQKCGVGKAFMLGDGALFAAVSGMCD